MRNLEPRAARRRSADEYRQPRAPLQARGRPLATWLERLDVEPLWAAEWLCEACWGIPPRRIGDSMWWWLLEGRGSVRVGEEAVAQTCEAGDLILVPQGERHELRPDPGSAWRITVVHFHARVYGGADLLRLLGFPARLRPSDAEAWSRRDRALAREYAMRLPGYRATMAANIRLALTELLREHGDAFLAPDPGVTQALARLQPVFALVDSRMHDPRLRAADLAGSIHVSEVRLRSLCKQALGLSPMRYLLQRRLVRACERLRVSDDGVQRIATECGFSDSAYFCRAFKRLLGQRPGEYRNSPGI